MIGRRLREPGGPCSMFRPTLLCLILTLLAFSTAAEQGILVVQVADPAGRPIGGIQIGLKGDGSLARTGDDGKARIVLARDTTEGSPITLMLGPQHAEPDEEWVFRSPDGGRTVVPSFDNGSESFVPVVLETLAAKNEVTVIVETLVASYRLRDSELQEQIRALTAVVEALAAQRDQPGAPSGIDEALAALAQGETEAAEAIFQKVLDRKQSEAKTAEQEAVKARQEAAEAARHLGALAFLDDTDKAMTRLRRAVELDPANPWALGLLGHLLLRVGPVAEAEMAYRRMLALGSSRTDPSVSAAAWGSLGAFHWSRGNWLESEQMLRRALSIDEDLGRKPGDSGCVR